MLGEYTNKKMAATSPCQLQNNTMIETRCYPSSVLCIRLCSVHKISLMATWSLLILVGYSVTAHPCYGAVGMHPTGMLSCCQ